MLKFEEGKIRVTYRATGIAFNNNRVLLSKKEDDDFWYLPGSWVKLLESPEDALKRSPGKELDTEIQIDRLVWVVENYSNNKSYDELYFLVILPDNSSAYWEDKPFVVGTNGSKQIFKWHSLDELKEMPLYPAFLRTALRPIMKMTMKEVRSPLS